MPFEFHTVEVIDGSQFSNLDKAVVGIQTGVVTAAGGGAGQSVTTAITFGYTLPPTYTVHATSNLATTVNVTAKTNTGFNVVITPVLAATTLAAGTLDVMVIG